MNAQRFKHAFNLTSDGRLLWASPPKNHAELLGKEAGCICKGKGKNKSYWYVRLDGKTYKRSRVVYLMVHGVWPIPFVDHINGDSLDDRPANLRQATPSQNTANSRDKTRSHDLPRGVYRTKQGMFMARLTINGITKSLGVFETSDQAKAVYMRHRREAFGEYV